MIKSGARYILLCCFILTALFSACSSETFISTENGIIATIKTSKDSGVKLVREQMNVHLYSLGIDASQNLTIGERQDSFEGMIDQRTIHVTLIDGERPVALLFDDQPGHTLKYKGQKTVMQL